MPIRTKRFETKSRKHKANYALSGKLHRLTFHYDFKKAEYTVDTFPRTCYIINFTENNTEKFIG